jgi:nicotinamidase-related amidase
MPKTEPEPIRDPVGDRLLTPANCVIGLIDFQPEQYATITSASRAEIDLGVVTLAKLAAAYRIPTVVTTVAVDMGVNEPTVPEIMSVLPDVVEIDRTGVNAWEDPDFRAAIEATGRRKVVLAGLWTEVCLAFPTLDLLAEGYEVFPVADAVGGVSGVTHDRAFDRMIAAGAQPTTSIAFGCEIMRNWARDEADLFRPIINWYFATKRELGLWEGGKVPSAG